MKNGQKILIAGAHGMVGRNITSKLLGHKLLTPTRKEIDFTQQKSVREYLSEESPDVVIISAAKVGGIYANMTYPAEFLYANMIIACNLIHESHQAGVDRLLFLGSSCIYPKFAPQPIKEEALLTGPLEPTNEAYAIAKIAGVKMCQYYSKQFGRKYISVMPTNLYGPGDNYHPENSHVIPGLIRRFHEAKLEGKKEVSIWGSGKAKREFLHVSDLAEACVFLLEKYFGQMHVNVGSEEELEIGTLAQMIKEVVGFEGRIVNDYSKPEGTPRKKTDCSKILSLGWRPKKSLKEGLKGCYEDFLSREPVLTKL